MATSSEPERWKSDLEHARWRVAFLLALLDSHRRLTHRWEGEWHQKEIGYLKQICQAQVELDRLESVQDFWDPRRPRS